MAELSSERIAAALDALRYMAAQDPRFFNVDPRLRVAAVHVAERFAALADVELHPSMDAAAANLLQMSGIHGVQRASPTPALLAFVRTNPMLVSMPVLHTRFAPQTDLYTLGNMRHAERLRRQGRRAAKSDELLVDPVLPRLAGVRQLRGKAYAIHPSTGYYYFEMDSDNAIAHRASPWYMFHSWAWGRRCYAEWLEANGFSSCPISGLTLKNLRTDNRADGSGLAWLRLACDYANRLRANRTSLISLPIPAWSAPAHLAIGTPFSNPGKQGTSYKSFLQCLNDELQRHGLAEFSPAELPEDILDEDIGINP